MPSTDVILLSSLLEKQHSEDYGEMTESEYFEYFVLETYKRMRFSMGKLVAVGMEGLTAFSHSSTGNFSSRTPFSRTSRESLTLR
jgi:hypothetical protein